jgi:hypothetical protein
MQFSLRRNLLVMRGLDPRIHDERQPRSPYVRTFPSRVIMDCRVKPGNDRIEVDAKI